MNFPYTVTWKMNYADDFMLFLLNFQWIIHIRMHWRLMLSHTTYSMHIISFCMDAPGLRARLHNVFWMLMKQMQDINVWSLNDLSLSLSPGLHHACGGLVLESQYSGCFNINYIYLIIIFSCVYFFLWICWHQLPRNSSMYNYNLLNYIYYNYI